MASLYKTRMCHKGSDCRFGRKCIYAHNASELRTAGKPIGVKMESLLDSCNELLRVNQELTGRNAGLTVENQDLATENLDLTVENQELKGRNTRLKRKCRNLEDAYGALEKKYRKLENTYNEHVTSGQLENAYLRSVISRMNRMDTDNKMLLSAIMRGFVANA